MVRNVLLILVLSLLAMPASVHAQAGGAESSGDGPHETSNQEPSGDASSVAAEADAAQPPDTAEASPDGAYVKAVTVFNVDDFGIVSVLDSWSGLAQESGTYLYMSATRELGRIPVRVKDHKFSMSFATRSYLIEDKEDPTLLFFRTPMYFYEGGSISVDITLILPSRLSYIGLVGNTPEPTSVEGGRIKWTIPDATGMTFAVELSRSRPFLVPGEGGPQFDPADLPRLRQEEIPKNADEVLRELETILLIAESERSADPDLIKLLNKNLARLYYLFYLYGLVADYKPGDADGGGG